MGCDAKERKDMRNGFISIHAARVGCDGDFQNVYKLAIISIHAARVGCDLATLLGLTAAADFNPRSPSGLRLFRGLITGGEDIFQSTQPEWAATSASRKWICLQHHFNPRSPSGLRLLIQQYHVTC